MCIRDRTNTINDTTLVAPYGNFVGASNVANNMNCSRFDLTFQWIQASTGLLTDPLYLGVSSGVPGCARFVTQSDRTSDLEVELIVFRANTLIVFETEPADANAELYYDASESFSISQPDGFHSVSYTHLTLPTN